MSEYGLNYAVALALGLPLGIERERRKWESPTRGAAGLRTFGLAALLGAVAIHVGGPWALLTIQAGVALLAAMFGLGLLLAAAWLAAMPALGAHG